MLLVGRFAALGGAYFFISSLEGQLEFSTPLQVGGGTEMALTAAAELLPKDCPKIKGGSPPPFVSSPWLLWL